MKIVERLNIFFYLARGFLNYLPVLFDHIFIDTSFPDIVQDLARIFFLHEKLDAITA